MHQHEHHSDDHHHDHEHLHDHDHTHDGKNHHGGNHHGGNGDGHDNLLKGKEEAAAFLQYTLHHNAHHEEELDGLAHSLEHLQLDNEAHEVRLCIEDITNANKRLAAVLAALK